MVHRRSQKGWLNRRLRSFFLSKSFKDAERNETVFTERVWAEMEQELNETFPQDSHKKPDYGQVLCDGRGRGGFQQ